MFIAGAAGLTGRNEEFACNLGILDFCSNLQEED
jgi:hypothetical protein